MEFDIKNLRDFENYLSTEVGAASGELDGLEERSRKHLQKLVYTNLIDRFDSMVDQVILDNGLLEPLLTESLAKLKDQLTEGEILRLFVDSGNASNHVDRRVKEALRNGILRERHSKKLGKLLGILCPGQKMQNPRVNISTGQIKSRYKSHNKKIPSGILGYADWLYSRRNAVVHGGGGSKMLKNDLLQLKKIYTCDAAESVKLSLGSINTASTFYGEILEMMSKD